MNITIKTVKNNQIKKRRGFTGADWWYTRRGNLEIRVAAELTDWREAMALAIHEATEALMCKHMGISQASVDEFDAAFQGENEIDVNAGDDPKAPYKIPHTYATAIERVLTGALEVDWLPYDQRLSDL